MSHRNSPKRSRAEDDEASNDHPSKKQCAPRITGLEDEDVIPQPMRSGSRRSTLKFLDLYERRQNAANLRAKNEAARSISSAWDGMSASAQKGMRNITGVLCYRHSLLQALVHNPKLGKWLEMIHPREKICEVCVNPKACVGCTVREVIHAYWNGDRNSMSVALFGLNFAFRLNGWGRNENSQIYFGQEDPEEQYLWLMNLLKQQLSPVADVLEAFQELFLQTAIICNTCGPVSKPSDLSELHLGISLQPRIRNGTLEDYVHQYFRDEIPADFKCEKCKDVTKAKERRTKILHAPDNLVIAFKRYTITGHKDAYPVTFGTTLDLSRYRDHDSPRSAKYELSAVVAHRGSLSGGHYRCTAKGPDGKWNIFDDEKVNSTTEREACNPGTGRNNSWTPYMLFYQRIVPEEPEERRQKRRDIRRPKPTLLVEKAELPTNISNIQAEAPQPMSTSDTELKKRKRSMSAESVDEDPSEPLPKRTGSVVASGDDITINDSINQAEDPKAKAEIQEVQAKEPEARAAIQEVQVEEAKPKAEIQHQAPETQTEVTEEKKKKPKIVFKIKANPELKPAESEPKKPDSNSDSESSLPDLCKMDSGSEFELESVTAQTSISPEPKEVEAEVKKAESGMKEAEIGGEEKGEVVEEL